MANPTVNPTCTRTSTHRYCALRISVNLLSDLRCWQRRNLISHPKLQQAGCGREDTVLHEAVWIRDSSRTWRHRTLQGISSKRLAGSSRRDPALEHPELLHLFER